MTEIPQSLTEQGHEIIARALAALGLPAETRAELTLTDDETIREINRTYRQIDRSTDVLSFPLNSPEDVAKGVFERDPDTCEILLGDIVLSYPTMMRQAEEYGHGVTREYTYLLIHSILHLLGYDHMTEEDKTVMRAKEEEIYREIVQ